MLELFSLENLFTLESLFTLLMLVLLQAVLGFDNLLYISIESKRVDEEKQSSVRKLGIGLAIGLRIVLLVVLLFAIGKMKTPFFTYGLEQAATVDVTDDEHADTNVVDSSHVELELTEQGNIVAASFNVHSVIVLLGGIFIIYTAFKEIFHMLSIDHIEHSLEEKKKSVGHAVFWIVLMNLVFSFDSILSAIALTDQAIVMAIAIIISGVMMIYLADTVATFLKRNRMYEVLGLFVLLIVGVMLVTEGGHLAHLHFFKYPIVAMSTSTFYFVIGVMVVVDIVQSRYQTKLMAQRAKELEDHA